MQSLAKKKNEVKYYFLPSEKRIKYLHRAISRTTNFRDDERGATQVFFVPFKKTKPSPKSVIGDDNAF